MCPDCATPQVPPEGRGQPQLQPQPPRQYVPQPPGSLPPKPEHSRPQPGARPPADSAEVCLGSARTPGSSGAGHSLVAEITYTGGGWAGTCFNFHSSRGGGPLPPGPPPPLPPQLKCTRKPGFWEHFLNFFGAFGACHTLCAYCFMCAPYTLFSRLPCPNARCQCISAPQSHRCYAQNVKM